MKVVGVIITDSYPSYLLDRFEVGDDGSNFLICCHFIIKEINQHIFGRQYHKFLISNCDF